MSTASSTLDAAWSAAVWQHATIQAITTKILDYDVTTESEKEVAALTRAGKVNCISCVISRVENYIGTNVIKEDFTVTITYLREKDASGAGWTAVRDCFETIDTLVKSELGDTWDATVLGWSRQKDPPTIAETTILSAPCWRGTFQYYGFI